MPRIKNFVLPLIFLVMIFFSIFFEKYLSIEMESFFYTLSLFIKESLIFILPVIIFSLVFKAVYDLGTRAIKYILLLIPLICFSNFINTLLSYMSSAFFLSTGVVISMPEIKNVIEPLVPIFNVSIPKIISNDKALIMGLILGLFFSFIKAEFSTKLSNFLGKISKCFFKILIPIMPVFIIGTILKLQHDGILTTICTKYFPIFLVFIITAGSVVLGQYFVVSGFKMNKFMFYIKNIFPAVITGFGSMSSAAVIPLSVRAAEENIVDKSNASIIVPSTVNIHLVGDCFFIPMLALTIMYTFGLGIPELGNYLMFSCAFVMAKFAVAAVPGGGVLVMLPILEKYLGFNTDMLGIITAVYVLFDPIITAFNIAGNGAMAIIFDKLTRKLKCATP